MVVGLTSAPEETRAWQYRNWHAVLQAGSRLPEDIWLRFIRTSFRWEFAASALSCETSNSLERIAMSDAHGKLPIDTLAISLTSNGGIVEVTPEWLACLRARENDAEVALAASVFRCLAQSPDGPSTSELGMAVLHAVGWHVTGDGFTHSGPFALKITSHGCRAHARFSFGPYSAHCLVKCGSVWNFRDRSLGAAIDGKKPVSHLSPGTAMKSCGLSFRTSHNSNGNPCAP